MKYVAFFVLYIINVGVSCGAYLCTQVAAAFAAGAKGRGALAMAGLAGSVGFYLITPMGYGADTWLCDWLGPDWSAEFWWFLLSDVAMFYLARWTAKDAAGKAAAAHRSAVLGDLEEVLLLSTPEGVFIARA